ncbi:MAG TPA: hypothetical protein VLK24_11660 [Gaiellaceae bacterium]|nr:hypothetical protein [Gaiellaceae bacterium]
MLVRIDAVFEAVLGIVLLLCAATGVLDGSDFPRPVGTLVLVIVGLALVVVAVLIWSGRVSLRALVVCNAASAVAGIAWLVAVSGFSTAGTIAVAVTVAGLSGLTAVQAATLRA